MPAVYITPSRQVYEQQPVYIIHATSPFAATCYCCSAAAAAPAATYRAAGDQVISYHTPSTPTSPMVDACKNMQTDKEAAGN